LGSLVITLALLQAIRPVWLAGIVTVLGSFSILLGTYVAYYSLSKQHQAKKLIDEAIERVVKEQN
jgi:predicted anti-sigma-YlaC factor YlaD